jgi:hypothetical protein
MKSRVEVSGGDMGGESQPTNRRLSFDAPDDAVGDAHAFYSGAEHKPMLMKDVPVLPDAHPPIHVVRRRLAEVYASEWTWNKKLISESHVV